jgi:alpha/beta superfamily hydrolase
MPRRIESLFLAGPAGRLEAILEEPEHQEAVEAAVVCHPHPAFGGRMDNPLVVALAEACAAAGFSTVRFNFRGLDGSEGTPTGGLAEHEDVAAASVASIRSAVARRARITRGA